MSLANNHARDFGEEGRSSSMAALDALGIHHSGREGTTASWIANGRRVALVAFAPNVGANQLNEPEVARALVSQLAATHDIVIVSFHGGAEGNGAEVLPFAREMFAGQDRATWSSSRAPWSMPARMWSSVTDRTWCARWSCIMTG
jgi:poly-gamma-glutamate capsule biosynthesis protein CapA/YwtB (metallophosphatase superfamily)